MARQERAERTRRALIHAAAREFAEHGFAGTSLARISGAAGVTMGALTFHFATKGELADAVAESGGTTTRQALPLRPGPAGVADVVGFTRTLARLLEQEVVVRAAARLTWDRSAVGAGWYGTWLPLLHDLVGRADEELAAWASPQAVVALALSVVAGAETAVRLDGLPGAERVAAPAHHATLVWDLALPKPPT
ncbi:TetR/AcrR family transcriptional regulator [Streptomyces sp. MMG1533]|uniref:TetR/AcrR family transcriptional regulator n=1 Tax=Streptomyces sp. MMG1533 TaxID=1415546 RepID=UPI0003C9E746|nr:TetR/AcrR family transcriptional regulator [Streptomyces sp. MMG1533]AGZ94068.1 regulatory protein [Streptomyces sp. MMG1533]